MLAAVDTDVSSSDLPQACQRCGSCVTFILDMNAVSELRKVLPVDGAVALRGAQLHVPTVQPLSDGLIAATALVHGMTVVTRDAADFLPCGVNVLNPWQGDSLASVSP